MKKIIPAILSKTPADFRMKISAVSQLADWVQIDVIDDKFASNTSLGLEEIVEITKDFSYLNLEVHLMVKNPEKYLSKCLALKVRRIFFHQEATNNSSKILDLLNKYSIQAGIAINPKTSLDKILPYLTKLDAVLFLGVKPGFSGQKFMPEILEKIKQFQKITKNVKIEVDGGVNLKNIADIAEAGADYLAIGSGLFDSDNIKKRFQKLEIKIKNIP